MSVSSGKTLFVESKRINILTVLKFSKISIGVC